MRGQKFSEVVPAAAADCTVGAVLRVCRVHMPDKMVVYANDDDRLGDMFDQVTVLKPHQAGARVCQDHLTLGV
jgi:hypothetical protein